MQKQYYYNQIFKQKLLFKQIIKYAHNKVILNYFFIVLFAGEKVTTPDGVTMMRRKSKKTSADTEFN